MLYLISKWHFTTVNHIEQHPQNHKFVGFQRECLKEYNIERPGHFIDWQPSCTNIACALRMPRNGRWRSFWPSSELLMMHEGKLFSFIPCIPQCVVKSRKKVSVLRLNLSTNMANDAAAAAFKLETEKEWRNCMLHEPGQSFVKHFRQPFSIYGYS